MSSHTVSMKNIIFLFLISLSFSAFAKPGLCSLKHANAVIQKAQKHSGYDKNNHCTVSCMLSLRCNKGEVLMVGYLKEIKDLFGKGNAERQDIVADKYGIDLVKFHRARNDQECLTQCDLRF